MKNKIQKELDDFIKEISPEEDENGYMDAFEPDEFEQGYMRGLEVALSLCDDLKPQLDKLDTVLYDDLSDYNKGIKDVLNIIYGREDHILTINL